MDLNLKEIINLLDCRTKNISNVLKKLSGITIDSRENCRNKLFIGIKGDNFDGNKYIMEAAKKGAACVLTNRKRTKDIPSIIVENTIESMGTIAKYYRNKFNVKTIAITGSCGKTTTKSLIADILSSKYKVLSNEGSFNNNIGVPLTIFKLNKKHQIFVIETGMNARGEIDYLSKMVQPDIAVITNIKKSHLEGLGNIRNIALGKQELLLNLNKKGCAVLNWDDKRIREISSKIKCKKIKYGINSGSFRFDSINKNNTFYTVKKSISVHIPQPGLHSVYNCLCAIAAVRLFNVPYHNIKKRIENFKTNKHRLKIYKKKGFTIIDDCYNANPSSTMNALCIINDMEKKGKKIFVFGDMLELGRSSKKLHRDIGKFINKTDIDSVILFGNQAKNIEPVIKNRKVNICKTHAEMIHYLKTHLKKNDIVLIKGSRRMSLEKVVKALRIVSG